MSGIIFFFFNISSWAILIEIRIIKSKHMNFHLKPGMWILLRALAIRCICCSCSSKMCFPSWKLLPKAVLDIMSAERFCSSLCTSLSNSSLPLLTSSHSSNIFLVLATISGTHPYQNKYRILAHHQLAVMDSQN